MIKNFVQMLIETNIKIEPVDFVPNLIEDDQLMVLVMSAHSPCTFHRVGVQNKLYPYFQRLPKTWTK